MDKFFLIVQLNAIQDARRINRLRVTQLILENKVLFPYLLETVFDTNNKTSIKAAWVLEFVCAEKLEWLVPHLSYFCKNINKVTFDSAIRPISKICEFLAKSYSSKKESPFKIALTKKHIDLIVEVGFDWLIGQQKVAVKAYTMEMLYLFGKNYDWIHEELKLVLQQNLINESPGYQARGKKIVNLINKK